MKFTRSTSLTKGTSTLIQISTLSQLKNVGLSKEELAYAKKELKDDDSLKISRLDHSHWIFLSKKKTDPKALETLRSSASLICAELNKSKAKSLSISCEGLEEGMALAEGIALSNYQFLKYFKEAKKKANSLKSIKLHGAFGPKDVAKLNTITAAVYATRDLVNEPLSYLTAPQLGKEIKKLSKQFGFKAEVMGRKKIEALKMGGLLAVNRGSVDDPTFSILEWKPKKATNKKPIVLVGKGVVYDTGGLSLKPTPNSMDMMKCDMAGAAMMIGAMCAISQEQLPLHVIALIPATDNRPGGNAYAPGDVVTMYDGTTVEVLNTDAEGRMLLADALAYAKKYEPELVIESSTLTGAAVRAIGSKAACVMGNADEEVFQGLEASGYSTHERLARMPFWDDYGEQMKSEIADLKNLGGAEAGHITAGKFLEHFTDYPYVHIDIAGPSYITYADSYRGKYGTGYGVRLLLDYLSKL